MLSDPKTLIIIVLVIALACFVYYSWRKTKDSLTELEDKQSKLQTQITHGVISNEKLTKKPKPLPSALPKINGGAEQEPSPPQKQKISIIPSPFSRINGIVGQIGSLIQGHQQHTQPEIVEVEEEDDEQEYDDKITTTSFSSEVEDESNMEFEADNELDESEPSEYDEVVIQEDEEPDINLTSEYPNDNVINELRQLKNKPHDDMILIDNNYDSDGEPIEFQEIDEENYIPETIPYSVVMQRQNEEVNKKVLDDAINMKPAEQDPEPEELPKESNVEPVVTKTSPKPVIKKKKSVPVIKSKTRPQIKSKK